MFEKGKKQEPWVEYCIVLGEGPSAGLRLYFPVSRKKMEKEMQKILNSFKFATSDKRAYFDIDYITKNKGDRISVVKGLVGSLRIYSKNRETLENCFEKIAEYWGININ